MKKLKATLSKALPQNVWALSLASIFGDASSELMTVFIVSLGATMTTVGLVEGASEAVALFIKIFSGPLSDLMAKRKWLVVAGFMIGAGSKLLFPFVTSVNGAFLARSLDRLGKGMRDAPRDALIGECAHSVHRGVCFGLRQSFETFGAFLGPLTALLCMALFSGEFHEVFWIAVIPGFIAMIFLLWVKEPKERVKTKITIKTIKKLYLEGVLRLGLNYWKILGFGCLLALGRLSPAFQILKAQSNVLKLNWVSSVIMIINIFCAVSGCPAGILSDQMSRKLIFVIGIFLLIVSNLLLASGCNLYVTFSGIAFWGLHMGVSESILSTMITDTTLESVRGTAYGVYSLAVGIGTILSNLIAGILWDYFGSEITFIAGAGFSLIAFLLAVFVKKAIPQLQI